MKINIKFKRKLFYIILLIITFNVLGFYFIPKNIENLKILIFFSWIILIGITLDKRKEELCSFNNQFIISTTIFSITVFLLSNSEKLYLSYSENYKTFFFVLKALNLLLIYNSLFYLGTSLFKYRNKQNKQNKFKSEQIINYIYFILFICFSFLEIKNSNYTYLEKTLLQNQKSGFLTILPKIINIQLGCILLRNIFQIKKNIKKNIILLISLLIVTFSSGDRASFLSFLMIGFYFYIKKIKNFSFKKNFYKITLVMFLIYCFFVLMQSNRNRGAINYKWEYDTFDTYLLALHYYKDKILITNSFSKIFINLIPRVIYPEKGILLGKILKLISVGAPIEDYKLYGSTALNLQGEIFLNFRYLGSLFIFIMGILAKKIEQVGNSNNYYYEMIYAICIAYFFLIIRGDLVSQSTKLIISLLLFNFIYMSIYTLEIIIKNRRSQR
ncbi:MAG: O-antigen polysaccharide polymerase Wzy [Cetobacterium sp.]